MKTKIISSICVAALAALLLLSCKKKEDQNTQAPVDTSTSTTNSNKFTWQEDNGSVISADSAFWVASSNGGTGIKAYKDGLSNYFNLNWVGSNNISVGQKFFDAPYFEFVFAKGATTYKGTTTQTLSITSSASNIISGTFSAPLTGGTITNVTGTFNNLSKK